MLRGLEKDSRDARKQEGIDRHHGTSEVIKGGSKPSGLGLIPKTCPVGGKLVLVTSS